MGGSLVDMNFLCLIMGCLNSGYEFPVFDHGGLNNGYDLPVFLHGGVGLNSGYDHPVLFMEAEQRI